MSVVTRRIVSWVLLLRRTHAFPADRFAPVIDETPDTGQEPEAALEARVGPLDFLLRRRHEHDVQAQGIRTVLLEHRVGVDNVALRLRHDRAVLEHHALREELGERLGVVDHAEIAEHAREEARVDQVQDRVLDPAAVEVDGEPVHHLRRIERLPVVPRIREPVEIPG